MTAFSLTVGTGNVQDLPARAVTAAQAQSDFTKNLRATDVLGSQEVGSTENRNAYAHALKAVGGRASFRGTGKIAKAVAEPLAWNTAMFEVVDTQVSLLHKGSRHLSPTRYITAVLLRHRVTGIEIGVVNTHFVAFRWSGRLHGAMLKQADKMYTADLNHLESAVLPWVTRGIPFVVFGDMNRRLDHARGTVLARKGVRTFHGRRFQTPVAPASIDHIYLVDGQTHAWTVTKQGVAPGRGSRNRQRYSDHGFRWATTTLAPVGTPPPVPPAAHKPAAKPVPKPKPKPSNPVNKNAVPHIADVSRYQSDRTLAHYQAAKASGLKAVYARATYSLGSKHVKDAFYDQHRTRATAAGLRFGAYIFADPSLCTGKQAAQLLLKHAAIKPGDLAPMLDLERTGGLNTTALTNWANEFMTHVASKIGIKGLVYTKFNLNAAPGLLWTSRYNDAMAPPPVARPWKHWTIWQYTDGKDGRPDSIPGLGHVDLSTIAGDPDIVLRGLTVPKMSVLTRKPTTPVLSVVHPLATAQRVLAAARKEVNYHERIANGHGTNDQKYSKQVPGLEWSNQQPWCQTFVTWVARSAGVQGLYGDPKHPTASVQIAAAWYKAHGRWSEYPAIGAQVFYATLGGVLDHTGIVDDFDADHIFAIEGNTNSNGSREGTTVLRKTRLRRSKTVVGYGLPLFPEGIVSADPARKHPTPAPAPAPAPAPVAVPHTVGTPNIAAFANATTVAEQIAAAKQITNPQAKPLVTQWLALGTAIINLNRKAT